MTNVARNQRCPLTTHRGDDGHRSRVFQSFQIPRACIMVLEAKLRIHLGFQPLILQEPF